jgi:hypothetical protein
MAELAAERAAGQIGARNGLLTRLQAAPGAWSLAVALALAALYGLSALASGEVPWGPAVRANLVIAAILVFTLWAGLRETGAVAADLDALRPVLTLDEERYDAIRNPGRRRRSLAAAALGAAAGLAIHVGGRWVELELKSSVKWATVHSLWNVMLLMILFALMGQRAHASLAVSRLFSSLGGEHTRVRLLDPSSLRPFARRGVRLASYWFIGSAIASLLFVEGEADPPLTAGVIAVTLGLGVLTLLLPCRGIHRRLHEAKQAELARVRRAIERRASDLLGGTPQSADEGLAALVAYEARIEAVREWPFDTPTLARFALFFLIPLGSWIGGAVVERIVDTVFA